MDLRTKRAVEEETEVKTEKGIHRDYYHSLLSTSSEALCWKSKMPSCQRNGWVILVVYVRLGPVCLG
jgi:hypothetical protein